MEPLPKFFSLERTVAFSDGVFAIVITILVLGIELPADVSLSEAAIGAERAKLLHQLLVYFVAFWLTGMYWTQHGLLFAGLRRMDRGLVVLNLLFLLPITLLPFVTQLMGTRRDDWVAVLIFALTNLFAVTVLGGLWRRVLAAPETHAGSETPRLARRIVRSARVFALVLVSGVLVSLLDVKAGVLVILFVPLVFFLNFLRHGRPWPSDPSPGDIESDS